MQKILCRGNRGGGTEGSAALGAAVLLFVATAVLAGAVAAEKARLAELTRRLGAVRQELAYEAD